MNRLLRIIREKLPTNRLGKGLALIAGGNILGQILTIAASPILTRLFTPSEFGILAAYISIISILTVALTLKYDQAIALPETNEAAMSLVKLCLMLVLTCTFVCFIAVLFFRTSIAALLNIPEFNTYLFLLPLSVLLIGSFDTFRQWNIRFSNFALIGQVRLKQVIASLVVQICGSFAGAVALLAGQVVNQGLGSYTLGKKLLKDPAFIKLPFSDIKKSAIRYKRFPLFALWAALLNRTSVQFPVFFLTAIFDPALAGLYALASRVVKAPADILNSSLNSVFLSEAAIARVNGTLADLSVKTHRNLSIAVLPSIVLIAYISPSLFTFAFGENWKQAGDFARWISLSAYFNITLVPLMTLFSVLEKQKHQVLFESTLFALRVLAVFFALGMSSGVSAVALYFVLSAVCFIGFMFWIGKQIQNNVFALFPSVITSLAHTLAIFSPLLIYLAFFESTNYHIPLVLLTALLTLAHFAVFVRSIYK